MSAPSVNIHRVSSSEVGYEADAESHPKRQRRHKKQPHWKSTITGCGTSASSDHVEPSSVLSRDPTPNLAEATAPASRSMPPRLWYANLTPDDEFRDGSVSSPHEVTTSGSGQEQETDSDAGFRPSYLQIIPQPGHLPSPTNTQDQSEEEECSTNRSQSHFFTADEQESSDYPRFSSRSSQRSTPPMTPSSVFSGSTADHSPTFRGFRLPGPPHLQNPTIPVAHLSRRMEYLLTTMEKLNTSISDQLSGISTCMSILEDQVGSVPSDAGPERVSRVTKRQKFGGQPKRKSQEERDRATEVRNHLDQLLDLSPNPFVTAAEARAFSKLRVPYQPCCTVMAFQVDVHDGPHSSWNKSAAVVFCEDFLRSKQLPASEGDNIMENFFTRLKSIKQFQTRHEQREVHSTSEQGAQLETYQAQYARRYTLYCRRLEITSEIPELRGHLPMLQKMGVEAMSDDELDSGAGSNGTYWVLTPIWRNSELTDFLHILDSVYFTRRKTDGARKRGCWPRVRFYDPQNIKHSPRDAIIRNLPRNAYSTAYLQRFTAVELSLNPDPPYPFTHSSKIFQYIVNRNRTI